jgi:hypothetical protein
MLQRTQIQIITTRNLISRRHSGGNPDRADAGQDFRVARAITAYDITRMARKCGSFAPYPYGFVDVEVVISITDTDTTSEIWSG